MKNSKDLFHEVASRLKLYDSPEEIHSIAYSILEHVFSLSKTAVMSGKEALVTESEHAELESILQRLNANEPLQYVLGYAYFFGRKFGVNKNVLIPRPETEELVERVIRYIEKERIPNPRIIDIGTGSGCIPITLSLECPSAEVFATDISVQALSVAKENAAQLGANVNFIHHDILNEQLPVERANVIVSNPPYITEMEKSSMQRNVSDYEPDLALFVPDNDPLKFYKAIAEQAKKALVTDGLLIVEINAKYGQEVAELFSLYNYREVQALKDLSGNDRIVHAIK